MYTCFVFSTDKHKTSYTIIAHASNPLIDGTVHNVTEVILNKNNPKKFHQRVSSLVLMKIEPPIKIKSLQFFHYKPKYGLHVRIYGWIVTKVSLRYLFLLSNVGFFLGFGIKIAFCWFLVNYQILKIF